MECFVDLPLAIELRLGLNVIESEVAGAIIEVGVWSTVEPFSLIVASVPAAAADAAAASEATASGDIDNIGVLLITPDFPGNIGTDSGSTTEFETCGGFDFEVLSFDSLGS